MVFNFIHNYKDIISVENLLGAWREFLKGKRSKNDVQDFQWKLMDNILKLHHDLAQRTYCHGGYDAFNISDPKPRNIHKATVQDRLLHHAIYRKLYLYFDKRFIADSYSCRLNKGTHKAIERFKQFGYRVSKNNTRTCWILKCDIRKFFASVDHQILIQILEKHIFDRELLGLLKEITGSFYVGRLGVGLPLGNLTSQLFVNIYMNEFDQWMKHIVKAKYYIRYADDFVVLSHDKDYLTELIPRIADFLEERLKLAPHPDKVFIKTLASGVDFLGWVHFPDHRVLRTTTKRRMSRRLEKEFSFRTTQSYLGLLRRGNTEKLKETLLNPSIIDSLAAYTGDMTPEDAA
ncbi:MAG: reverse transcriptase/maturase family protein [Patescibacteria group bacterium]